MRDTGTDVTLIARSEWPPHWELEPISGFISGIGEVATSWLFEEERGHHWPRGKGRHHQTFRGKSPDHVMGKRCHLTMGGTPLHLL